MTPRHVLDELPFWVGDDLAPARRAAVEAHLAACASCRAEAATLRGALALLREEAEAPFDHRELLELRQAVMARVRREVRPRSRFSRTWILLPAAAVLAAALGAGLGRLRGGRRTAVSPPPRLARLHEAAPPPPAGPDAAVRPPLRRRAPHAPSPPDAPSPGASGPVFTRLEFYTGDPAIRIIWLAPAQAAPGEEPTL